MGPNGLPPSQLHIGETRDWQIEALHNIRDNTYDEDRCRIRTGNGPQAMAALRNMAIALIKRCIPGTVPRGQRYLTFHPDALLSLVGV